MQEAGEEAHPPGLSAESALVLLGSANGQGSPDSNCQQKTLLPILSFLRANFQGHLLSGYQSNRLALTRSASQGTLT